MTSYLSLLRAINVGGTNPVRMPDLKALYESLGLSRIRTYLQSGNVLFESESGDASAWESLIESQILKTTGNVVPVIIRSAAEFLDLVNSHPFETEQLLDPTRIAVVFLNSFPAANRVEELAVPQGSTDWFHLRGREVYLHCPDGFGRTKLTNTFFEKRLGVKATSRNWNTVKALLDLTA